VTVFSKLQQITIALVNPFDSYEWFHLNPINKVTKIFKTLGFYYSALLDTTCNENLE